MTGGEQHGPGAVARGDGKERQREEYETAAEKPQGDASQPEWGRLVERTQLPRDCQHRDAEENLQDQEGDRDQRGELGHAGLEAESHERKRGEEEDAIDRRAVPGGYLRQAAGEYPDPRERQHVA